MRKKENYTFSKEEEYMLFYIFTTLLVDEDPQDQYRRSQGNPYLACNAMFLAFQFHIMIIITIHKFLRHLS